ncbi:MAG: ribosome small subunit-dependent GTPase A [Bacteroidota bacterium]|nr:ribosome small subunit-dependent GTPase A [Bacteroidota bacterium]
MKKGIVIKSTGSWCTVKTESGEKYECKLKGNLRMKGIRTTNPVTIGDVVSFEILKETGREVGLINTIQDRRNYILRKASNLSKESQILAANIDQVYLIVTINHPVTTTLFIDRFLVSAEAYRIPVNLVFNKIDIYSPEDLEKLEELNSTYQKIGYKTFNISLKTEENVPQLVESMKGKINLLSGHSGVGKSSLVNYIDKDLELKTSSISDYHNKGKHTTTYSEMFHIENGNYYIIDTPGISGFGLIDMSKEEISHYFPEIFSLLGNCQFYNCTHVHEPGCAVKKGFQDGLISESRYLNYISIVLGDEGKYRLQ